VALVNDKELFKREQIGMFSKIYNFLRHFESYAC